MKKEELTELLKPIADSITFSDHFAQKAKERGISSEEILNKIRSLDRLLLIEDQGDEPRGHKYGLLFGTTLSNYDLKVVVSIHSKSLNIITAHLQNVKKKKAYRRWLEQ
ncbi:MAG: DUF4258 domain-containing protein [Candidatus Micrarchaeota archaeon]|nr:DUF4258 domain-containing protein [Candidatus Micrarchaeota archaeon]